MKFTLRFGRIVSPDTVLLPLSLALFDVDETFGHVRLYTWLLFDSSIRVLCPELFKYVNDFHRRDDKLASRILVMSFADVDCRKSVRVPK